MLKHASELSVAPLSFIETLMPNFARAKAPRLTVSDDEARAPSAGTLKMISVLLGFIDPDITHDDWFCVGAAVFNITHGDQAGYVLFDSWSFLGNKYKGQSETRKLWASVNPNHARRAGMGKLHWYVMQAGYTKEDVQAALEPFDLVEGEGV